MEESVCLLKRAQWHVDYLEAHDKQSCTQTRSSRPPFNDEEEEEGDFEDEEDLYYYQGRSRVVLGNRRHGANGYVRGGRSYARAVNAPLSSLASPANAPGPSSSAADPGAPSKATPSKATPSSTPKVPAVKGKGSTPKVSSNPFKGVKKGSKSNNQENMATAAEAEGASTLAPPCPQPAAFPSQEDVQMPMIGPVLLLHSPSHEESSAPIASPPPPFPPAPPPEHLIGGKDAAVISPVLYGSPPDAVVAEEVEGGAHERGKGKGRRAQRASYRAVVDGRAPSAKHAHANQVPVTTSKKGARPRLHFDDDEGDDYY